MKTRISTLLRRIAAGFAAIAGGTAILILAACSGVQSQTEAYVSDISLIQQRLADPTLRDSLASRPEAVDLSVEWNESDVRRAPIGPSRTVGCDVPTFTLFMQEAGPEFWICQSGGFAGDGPWYGPFVMTNDGKVAAARP